MTLSINKILTLNLYSSSTNMVSETEVKIIKITKRIGQNPTVTFSVNGKIKKLVSNIFKSKMV